LAQYRGSVFDPLGNTFKNRLINIGLIKVFVYQFVRESDVNMRAKRTTASARTLGIYWIGLDWIVLLWYDGRFCCGTPILVNLDNSPEIDKWLIKSGSKINNHVFTYTPYNNNNNNNNNNNKQICIAP